MISLSNKRVLVFGSDPSAEAAVRLLRLGGAVVMTEENADSKSSSVSDPELVVISAGCVTIPPRARELSARGVPILGERELAFRESLCLHVAVTGTNGKSTTAELIAHLLRAAGRRVEVADAFAHPACAFVEGSRDLDFLIHAIQPHELDHLSFFRPVVAVLLNAPMDSIREDGPSEDLRRLSRVFTRQQAFDWAIVQSEALAQLRELGALPPGKVISFSAESRQSDLAVERGMLVSRLEGWTGPLWDLTQGNLRALHHAEDALAALAAGRVLRLPLDDMTHALRTFKPGPGRLEELGVVNGVRLVNDGRSANLDALGKALVFLAPSAADEPRICLIAGGDVAGRHFYRLGPLLASRVKQAFVFGEAGPAMRAAWSLFTPCSLVSSLLDAANKALNEAVSGDIVLFSPGCPTRENLVPPSGNDEVFRRLVDAGVRFSSEPDAGAPYPVINSGGGVAVKEAPVH